MDIVYKKASKAIILRNNNGALELLTFKYLETPNSKKKDKNGLPGGKLDVNETYEQALFREVQEETGLEIKIIDKTLGKFTFQYSKENIVVEVECRVFTAIVTGGKLVTNKKEEATSVISAPFWQSVENIDLEDFVYDEAPFVEVIKNNQKKYFDLT